jgi:hypothetical protein
LEGVWRGSGGGLEGVWRGSGGGLARDRHNKSSYHIIRSFSILHILDVRQSHLCPVSKNVFASCEVSNRDLGLNEIVGPVSLRV